MSTNNLLFILTINLFLSPISWLYKRGEKSNGYLNFQNMGLDKNGP